MISVGQIVGQLIKAGRQNPRRTIYIPYQYKKKKCDIPHNHATVTLNRQNKSALNRTRTCDTLVNSQVLYRLSY